MCSIKRKSESDRYKEEHHAELSLFYMARRELDEQFPEKYTDEKVLRTRLASLEKEKASLFSSYKKLKDDAANIYSIKKAIEADYRKALGETVQEKKKNQERSIE